MTVRALVLAGFGINCEEETATAFRMAGAQPDIVHLNDIIENRRRLQEYHILAVPGGFSFGDDIASGKVFANRLKHRLGDNMKAFVNDGKLVIGICNGFQVLVKMGLLPFFEGEFVQETTLTHNNSARFDNRWVHLKRDDATRCVWLKDINALELPIRNSEGKFMVRDDDVLNRLAESGQIALRYATPEGAAAKGEFPYNPNGSTDDIAGICDPSGRIFGLMPHPEAFLHRTNHPRWRREDLPEEGQGIQVFRNAVDYASTNLITEHVSF